jgi:hypothetical protein
MARPDRGMVVMQIYVPKYIRQKLEQIKQKDGVSVSQQARYSLALWIRRCDKDPHGAWGIIGNAVRDGWRSTGGPGFKDSPQDASESPQTALQKALEVMEHPEHDPKPDQHLEPAKWASWAKRQGDAAVKAMAAGYWGHPDPKGPADE